MKTQEFNFTFKDTEFYGLYVAPKKVNTVVLLVHGMGEHLGRYTSFVIPKLVEQNIAVVAYDQFGHGHTKGKKGHNPGYESLLDTLEIVIGKTQALFPDKPLFLYGHSMGGNVVINYVLRKAHPFKGVIATSPLLKLAFEPPKWKLTAGKLLQKIAPAITLPSELDTNAISRDPIEVENYINDPLVHDKISANYSLAVFDAGDWALQNASKLSVPTLVIHGTGDQITSHEASQQFVSNSNGNAQIKLFENGYHELHNDLEKESFIEEILHWITKVNQA